MENDFNLALFIFLFVSLHVFKESKILLYRKIVFFSQIIFS